MDLSKNACLFNRPSMDTQISKGERETTGVTGEWKNHTLENAPLLSQGIDSRHPHDQHDFFLLLPVGVENRLVETALPAQEKVWILGDEFESPAIPAKNNCQITDKEMKAPAEMIDVETAPGIPVKCHHRFTDYQINELENSFRKNPYLIGEELEDFAKKIGLTKKQVRLWYARKRRIVKESLSKVTTVDSLAVSDKPNKSSITKRKHKGKVERFSYEKLKVLNKEFKQCKWLCSGKVTCIVKETGLTRRQVNNWFYDKRRAEEKRDNEVKRVAKMPFKKRWNHKIIPNYLDLRVVDELRCVFKLHQNLTLKGVTYFSKKYGVSEIVIYEWFKRERKNYKKHEIKPSDIGVTESSVSAEEVVLSQSDLSSDLYRSDQPDSGASAKKQIFSDEDKEKLNEMFEVNPSPRKKEVKLIALMLGCQEMRVYHWFRNQRKKVATFLKKGDLGASDVLFKSVTPKNSWGGFSDSQVQQLHNSTRSIPSAALGAPPLSE